MGCKMKMGNLQVAQVETLLLEYSTESRQKDYRSAVRSSRLEMTGYQSLVVANSAADQKHLDAA